MLIAVFVLDILIHISSQESQALSVFILKI